MPEEISNEEKEQALMQIRAMQEEAQKIEEQIIELERRKMELDIVMLGIDAISKQDSGDSLIPVGSGVFVEGKITNQKEVLLNIGSNIVLRKNIPDAKKTLEEQIKEIDELKKTLQKDLSEFVKSLGSLKPRF